MSTAWIFLLLAGFFEICFTISLKYSQGFSKLIPSIITAVFIVMSFFAVSQAMITIPIGTAYAVWAGIGAAGTVVIGNHFLWRFSPYCPIAFDYAHHHRDHRP